jgi:hypothetical protein
MRVGFDSILISSYRKKKISSIEMDIWVIRFNGDIFLKVKKSWVSVSYKMETFGSGYVGFSIFFIKVDGNGEFIDGVFKLFLYSKK